MKKNDFTRRCSALAMIVVLTLNMFTSLAESYSASIMRLLNYEGEVHILDAEGNTRFIMENVRFNSGESLTTGEKAMASVSLDTTKVLTLDAMTQVTFIKESNQMNLMLSSGRLLLDVQQKLDENESFDIETSTMTVGIRGTVVYLASFDGSEEEINKALLESNESFRELLNRTLPNGYSGNFSQLVVLEGTAVATFQDATGQARSVEVHAGEKITVLDEQPEDAAVSPATGNDLGSDMVDLIQNDPALSGKIDEACDILKTDTNGQEAEAKPAGQKEEDGSGFHVHNFSTDFDPPTCTSDGVITYTCACGETFRGSGSSALGHDWGEWVTVEEATCGVDGLQRRTCQRKGCEAKEEKAVPALDHDWGEWVTVEEATCGVDGLQRRTCQRKGCEAKEEKAVPALDHDWGEWVTVEEATCTEDGQRRHTCGRCGESAAETIPANGHTLITDPAVAATCTESGWTEHIYCEVCEEVMEPYQTEIPALGHDWGEWVTVEEATCGVEGLQRRTCQRESCEAEEEKAIPATGAHVAPEEPVIENEVPETCTTGQSFDEVMYCTVCGAELSRLPYTTDAPGHDWGEWVTVEEPTCVDDGLQRRTCQREGCGAQEEKAVPATGLHVTPEEPVIENEVPETCTTGQSFDEVMYCTVCGAELSRLPYTTDAPGHLWGEWETVEEPTCTEPGQRQRACQREGCGETETDAIPANGHTPVEVEKPTCTEGGYEGRTVCSVCGEVIKEGTPAPALGGEHDFENVGDPFTDTYVNSDGKTMIQQIQLMGCTRCGYGESKILDEWEEGSHSITPGS